MCLSWSYVLLSLFFFQIRACSQRLLTQWKMSYDVTVNHWSNRMNSLTVTRPLPLHSQWKCLSAAITGGNSSSQSLSPVNIQPLRLGQKSCKQVLVFSENCRPHGCTFVPSQYFHTAWRVSVEHKLKTGKGSSYGRGFFLACPDSRGKFDKSLAAFFFFFNWRSTCMH